MYIVIVVIVVHIFSNMQDFFAQGGQVQIKLATLDRGIMQLKGIISLYRQTTDMLISDYIADSNRGTQNTDASFGELSMEIDAYHHPATGELEGTIRGMLPEWTVDTGLNKHSFQ